MSAYNVRALFIAALIALTAASTAMLRPTAISARMAPDLEAMLPDEFGSWRRVALSATILPPETELEPGEAVAYRAYQDDLGRTATLVIAYGPPLGDSVRLHRPEACYVAQGFAIRGRSESVIVARERAVPIVNLDAESPAAREAVTYWLREGPAFTTRAGDNAWRRLQRGISRPLDGALVRVSTINGDVPQFDLNRRFLSEFAAALDANARRTLLGDASAS